MQLKLPVAFSQNQRAFAASLNATKAAWRPLSTQVRSHKLLNVSLHKAFTLQTQCLTHVKDIVYKDSLFLFGK